MAEAIEDKLFELLSAPFPSTSVRFRVGNTDPSGSRGQALAYIESRDVMDRLDAVVGPANWKDEYDSGPNGGIMCRLSLRINGEWITKADGAENTEVESVKGGFSDALKRAGVKWRIGRYLYDLPEFWADVVDGRLTHYPALPDWALPESERGNPQSQPVVQPVPAQEAAKPEPQQLAQVNTQATPEPANQAPAASAAPEMSEDEKNIVKAVFERVKQGGDAEKAKAYIQESEHLSEDAKAFSLTRIAQFAQAKAKAA